MATGQSPSRSPEPPVTYRCVGGPLDGQYVDADQALELAELDGWLYEFNPRLAGTLTGRLLRHSETETRPFNDRYPTGAGPLYLLSRRRRPH